MEPLNAHDPRQLDGYTVLGRLGTSTSGTVYLGESTAGRRVVVKILPAPYASEPPARARFAREVEISRRLVGLFTPEVVGADVDAPIPWMVTRFIEGRSLYGEVLDGGPLAAPRVLEIATGIAEALTSVHAAGLVHRDLKPSNVVLARDGAHLIGFAAAAPPGESSLTPDGLIIGTVEYIAPELVVGGPATPAADVFSLGGVLYFAATGEPPFGSGHPAALIHRITEGSPDLDRIRDRGLRDLLAACLDRDPARRPTTERIVAETAATVPAAPQPGLDVTPVPFPAELMPDAPAPHHVATSPYTINPVAAPDRPTGGDRDHHPDRGHHPDLDLAEDVATVDTYRPPPSAVRRALTRRRLLVGAGSAVVLSGAGAGAYALLRPKEPVPARTATRVLEAHHSRVLGVGVTSDGAQALAVTSSGQLVIWDVASATAVGTITDGIAAFTTMATTPDGKTAFVGSDDGVLRIVDVPNRSVVRRVVAHQNEVAAIAVAPNGKFVITSGTSGENVVARVWDPATGTPVLALGSGDSFARSAASIAVSADSRTVATASAFGGKINLWDAATGRLRRGFTDDKQFTASVAFSPDGRTVATTRGDDTLCLWDAATGKPKSTLQDDHLSAKRAVYLPSGKAVLLIGFLAVNVVVPASKYLATRLSGPVGQLTGVAVTPDGDTVVAGSEDGDARVWSLPDGRNTAILRARPGGARSIAFSASGKTLVSGGDDAVLRIWDAATGEQLSHYRFELEDSLPAVAVSAVKAVRIAVARSSGVSTSGMSQLALVDPLASRINPTLLPVDAGRTLAFSPDGRLVATGGSISDGALIVDVATGAKVRTLVGQPGAVTGVAFSPDGTTLAVSSRTTNARLWNVADGTVRKELVGHSDHVTGVAFAPDGKTVVTAGKDATVRVWDVASGELRHTITGHSGAVLAVAVSSDGETIASAGADGVVRVWTTADADPVCRFTGHDGVVHALAFHPHTPTTLASAGQDGTVRLWTLPATKGK